MLMPRLEERRDFHIDRVGKALAGIQSVRDGLGETEGEILAAGVPKAIILYRSKIVDRMYSKQLERLADENMSDEERDECVKLLTRFNKVRLALSNESKRLMM